METQAIAIGIITLMFLWWNLAISVRIMNYLKEFYKGASLFNHGIFVRGKIFQYLPLYRRITLEKDGKVGSLYFSFYATFFMAMFSLVMGIIVVAF